MGLDTSQSTSGGGALAKSALEDEQRESVINTELS
jgi:hypothetical protein